MKAERPDGRATTLIIIIISNTTAIKSIKENVNNRIKEAIKKQAKTMTKIAIKQVT